MRRLRHRPHILVTQHDARTCLHVRREHNVRPLRVDSLNDFSEGRGRKGRVRVTSIGPARFEHGVRGDDAARFEYLGPAEADARVTRTTRACARAHKSASGRWERREAAPEPSVADDEGSFAGGELACDGFHAEAAAAWDDGNAGGGGGEGLEINVETEPPNPKPPTRTPKPKPQTPNLRAL